MLPILFNGTPEELQTGVISLVTWDDILPSIQAKVRLREDEIIDGFMATEEGLRVKISRKKGRKTSSRLASTKMKR